MHRFRYYCLHNMSILIYITTLLFHLFNFAALWQTSAAYSIYMPSLFPLVIINAVLFLLNLFVVCTYIRRNKLFVYTLYALCVCMYILSYIFITRTDPMLETLLIAQIAMTYMLTREFNVSRGYYIRMNSLFFGTLVAASLANIFFCTPPPNLEHKFLLLYRMSMGCTVITSLICLISAAGYSIFILHRTERRKERTEAAANYLANHDPLTKLMNRRRISEILDICQKRRETEQIHYALCIFDIDNFKHINDEYGHDCGDFILKELTRRIRAALPKDIKIGRWGGEEFLIIYPSYDDDTVFKLDAVRDTISKVPYNYNGRQLTVTATFGISSSRNLPTPDAVLTDADQHLLSGKTNGKNRLVVSDIF